MRANFAYGQLRRKGGNYGHGASWTSIVEIHHGSSEVNATPSREPYPSLNSQIPHPEEIFADDANLFRPEHGLFISAEDLVFPLENIGVSRKTVAFMELIKMYVEVRCSEICSVKI